MFQKHFNKTKTLIPIIICLLLVTGFSSQAFNLMIQSPEEFHATIFHQNTLQDHYDASIYQKDLDCTNGGLQIIEFQQTDEEELITFKYSGIDLARKDFEISVEPNPEPKPFLKDINRVYKKFILDAGCPNIINTKNYYNRVIIKIRNTVKNKSIDSPQYFTFSFLLNCDYMDLHKNFEYGYLIICLIGIFMVIFVSIHPRILSLRIHNVPLNLEINWKGFLFLMIIVLGCLLGMYAQKISARQFHYIFGNRTQFQIRLRYAHSFLKHLGLLISYFYVFVCLNQFFFEFPKTLKYFPFEVIKAGNYFFSKRMIFSLSISTIIYIFGIMSQNLIFYNTLSFCICIGAIKMFRFRSLKNGVYSMLIIAITVGVFSVWSYYKLPRSYNDYASEMSSPLFIQVPDLVNNLYKKCSWISIFDLIFPGAILAYLRDYDENLHIKWHGVYTMTSIFSFILCNLIWMVLEALTSTNLPFCVITYPIFLANIILMAFYRNQLETIWSGNFNLPDDANILEMLQNIQSDKSPKIPKQLFDPFYDPQESISDITIQKKSDICPNEKSVQNMRQSLRINKSKNFIQLNSQQAHHQTQLNQKQNPRNKSYKRQNRLFQNPSNSGSPEKRQFTPHFRQSRNRSENKNGKKKND